MQLSYTEENASKRGILAVKISTAVLLISVVFAAFGHINWLIPVGVFVASVFVIFTVIAVGARKSVKESRKK